MSTKLAPRQAGIELQLSNVFRVGLGMAQGGFCQPKSHLGTVATCTFRQRQSGNLLFLFHAEQKVPWGLCPGVTPDWLLITGVSANCNLCLPLPPTPRLDHRRQWQEKGAVRVFEPPPTATSFNHHPLASPCNGRPSRGSCSRNGNAWCAAALHLAHFAGEGTG